MSATESQMTMSLTRRSIEAAKWSMLGEFGSRLIGPILFIVLARVLLPEDFGVVAAAMVAISLSQVLWDAGLARPLVQGRDEDPGRADTALGMNLVFGLVLMVIVIATAPMIARLFHDVRIAPVLRVLALQLPLASASAVYAGLMQRRLEFRKLSLVRFLTTGIPGAASIPLALADWGYWALVAATLVGQVLQLAALWWMTEEKVTPRLERHAARELMSFAKWSVASGALGWVYGWLDAIVVGHFLGTRDMGLYRTGNTFVTVVFGTLFAPLVPVLYSAFSRAQDDLPRLRRVLLIVAHAICLVSLPIGLSLVMLRDDIGLIVFGPEWTGVGIVIAFLGASHAIGWIGGVNGELYRAIGRPHVETAVMALMLTCYVPVYLLAIRGGLETFLWARLSMSVLALGAHVAISWWAVGIAPGAWLRLGARAVPCVLAAAALLHLLALDGYSLLPRMLLTGLIGVGGYCLGVAMLERSFVRQLVAIARTRQLSDVTAGGKSC